MVEPATGRLTGADTGAGRLPEPAELLVLLEQVIGREGPQAMDLAGRRVVVTAGGTREPLDPVRFLGNRSSGRQGYALAQAAVARGADVVLIAANVELTDPAGAKVEQVSTTAQLYDAVLSAVPDADALVMAAAPADFRPRAQASDKIKRSPDGGTLTVSLEQNPDILATVAAARPSPSLVVVGFAAETGDSSGSVLDHARAKLARKGADLLVVNDVNGGQVFGSADNSAVVLGADGSSTAIPAGPKIALAHRVWDLVGERLPQR